MEGLTMKFEPPATVIVKIVGSFSPDKVTAYFNRLEELRDSSNVEKPNAIFILNELGDIPPETRKILRKRGSEGPIDHVAIVGASTKIRVMSGLILKMVPTVGKAKFFESEPQARSWLGGEQEKP